MITTLTKKWNAMRTTEKGGVLIFVALCLLPMFLILGLAVDSSYGLTEKRKLQMACDAAAKAGVANGGGVSATITSEAQKVFAANIANMTGITGPTISVNTSAKTVTVSASIVVSNVFMVLGGVPTSTYSATTTTSYGTALAEVVIIIEGSQRAAYASNFQQNVCAQLISFVNSLPSNVMVSIIPLSGEFSFDPSTTVSGNLFNHLSSTTNDESANPGYYPLSTNYAWTLANYNAIPNPYYGGLSQYPSAPTRTSYTSPATCPGSYSSCSSTLYTANCPSTTHQSCSSTYAYNHLPTYPMLPLTLNRTLITNYINSIKNFNSWSDAFFPSMISWAWRPSTQAGMIFGSLIQTCPLRHAPQEHIPIHMVGNKRALLLFLMTNPIGTNIPGLSVPITQRNVEIGQPQMVMEQRHANGQQIIMAQSLYQRITMPTLMILRVKIITIKPLIRVWVLAYQAYIGMGIKRLQIIKQAY